MESKGEDKEKGENGSVKRGAEQAGRKRGKRSVKRGAEQAGVEEKGRLESTEREERF